MPESSFDRDVLKTAVAQICHSLGWNSMQKSSLAVLTDVLERYMKKLSKATAGYCQHSSRIGVNLSDLGIAFDHLGIQICELEDYVHQVEPIHFPRTVPQCQPSISTAFHFPTEEELTSREEWYEEYMPPLGRSIKNDDTEMKLVEESEVNHMELAVVPPIDNIPETSVPTIDTPSNGRSMESPDVEAKAMWNDKLCLPDLVRPKLPSFDFIDSPSGMKQPSLPPSSPPMPLLPLKRSGSPLKSREKSSSNIPQDKVDAKEALKMDTLSPKPAKRPKVVSSPLQPDISFQGPKEARLKDNAKRPDSLALENPPKDIYPHKNLFSPTDRDSRLSPVAKSSSTIHSPSSEKVTYPSKAVSTPFLEWSNNQIAPPLSDKKSKTKKPKKVKKVKNIPSKSSKQNTSQPFSSSPQLFGSPHVLKSPPEQRVVIASQTSTKGSPRMEGKIDQAASYFHEKAPSTPEIKSKLLYSSPRQDGKKHVKGKSDVKLAKATTDSKKQSSKKAKKTSPAPSSAEMKEKSPLSVPERPQLFASVSLTKLSKNDSFRSPSSTLSPGMTTNAALAQDSSLNSPGFKKPDAKSVGSSKGDKKVSKKEEKKRKKEKKNKKKPTDEEPKSHKSQKGKQDTPSLKLTFKRAPSGAYNDHHSEEAPATLKLKGVSPTTSYPAATPTAEASPKKVASPPPEQKSRKPKKMKASDKKPEDIEKRAEPAVKIEPLVINDSYSNLTDYAESSDSAKKPESKPAKAAKKDTSVKKGKPAKKADTSKKVPKKKAEAAKKPPKSKANEVYQPDQYYSSPPPAALAGEQSVSRGLFIQTITEPTPTQVWYCPACLRPDDGSPMIGCDSCDGWYHWTCVGITQAPSEDVEWYCGTCVDRLSKKKIKKRKKKE